MAWSGRLKSGWETDTKCKAWISWLNEGDIVKGPLKDGEVPLSNVFNDDLKDAYAVRLYDGRIRNIKSGKVNIRKANSAGYYTFNTTYHNVRYSKKWARVVRFAGGDICPGIEELYHADHLYAPWNNGFYATRWLLNTENTSIENRKRSLARASSVHLYDCLTGSYVAGFARAGEASAFLHTHIVFSECPVAIGFVIRNYKTEKLDKLPNLSKSKCCVKVTDLQNNYRIFRSINKATQTYFKKGAKSSFPIIKNLFNNNGYLIEYISGTELFNEIAKYNNGEENCLAEGFFSYEIPLLKEKLQPNKFVTDWCAISAKLLKEGAIPNSQAKEFNSMLTALSALRIEAA